MTRVTGRRHVNVRKSYAREPIARIASYNRLVNRVSLPICAPTRLERQRGSQARPYRHAFEGNTALASRSASCAALHGVNAGCFQSHRFAVALDADRLAAKPRSC